MDLSQAAELRPAIRGLNFASIVYTMATLAFTPLDEIDKVGLFCVS